MGHNHNIFNKQNNKLVKKATILSFVSIIIIVIIKLIGWLQTDSISMLAALSESLLDIGASVINLVAVYYASQPPDNEHRFGHGKAEDLAVFTQAALFGASGIFLIIACIKRFFIPEPIENGFNGIIIMVLSIIITTLQMAFQHYVIKKTSSNIVEADYLHFKIDFINNFAVIASILLSNYFGTELADPFFAFLIAIYIMFGAWNLLKRAFKNLMDHELDDESKIKIMQIIKSHSKVKNVHDLKTRYSGTKSFIQFHLVLDSQITLSEAHLITHEIEEEILKFLPNTELIIHQDPDDVNEEIAYP